MSKYETTFFSYFENLKRSLRAMPLNLGGIVATGSGIVGGPPGGYLGYLPQSRVSYDRAELALSGFMAAQPYNASGYLVSANLLDNLNHIRYRLAVLEGIAFSNNTIIIKETGITVLSGTSTINFAGGVDVEQTGPGEVTVTVSGSLTDEKVKVTPSDTNADYLWTKLDAGDNINITVINPGSDEKVQISATGVGGSGTGTDQYVKVTASDTTADYLYNKVSLGSGLDKNLLYPGSDEELEIVLTDVSKTVRVSANDTSADYLEGKVEAGSGVGITVTNEGGNEKLNIAISGYTGGGVPLVIKEDGTTVISGAAFIDFHGSADVALSGNGAIVTISGGVGGGIEAAFVGAKVYLTANQQLSTSTGWQEVVWGASEYESDDAMWTSGASVIIQDAGYYSIIGQVTMSGALPTDERLQVGIFDVNTFKVGIYDGYYTSTAGYRSIQVLYQGYLSASAGMNMKVLNGQGTQPYVISGIANTFMYVHKIHGVVEAQEADPKTVSPYLTGYISANNETETAISWNAENYDTDSMWSSGSQIQINTAGYYHVDASAVWESLSNQGGTPFQIKIGVRLSGTTMIAQKWEWHDVDTGGDRSEGLSTPISCDTPYLTEDDYLEVMVWHSKGSTASNIIRPPAYNTYCMVHKIQ